MTFIFVYDNYETILLKKKDIVKKLKSTIITPNNDSYNLIDGIAISQNDHFTCFIFPMKKFYALVL